MYDEDLYLDTRLAEKAFRDGKVTAAELEAHLAALPDVSDNIIKYDREGNPTNLPKRELKILEVKPGEPETRVEAAGGLQDPLSEQWDYDGR